MAVRRVRAVEQTLHAELSVLQHLQAPSLSLLCRRSHSGRGLATRVALRDNSVFFWLSNCRVVPRVVPAEGEN